MKNGPRVVVIGGGSGLSVLLRGLKGYTSNITAIVTMADDGGGSGVLREDLGMLPPGDLRNCILALSNTEPIMERLLQYRFEDGILKGQCFGNLLIAAMVGISSNFEEAIQRVNEIFAVTGRVLPATTTSIMLCAELVNGTVVCGESEIPKTVLAENSAVRNVRLVPADAPAVRDAVSAIEDADLILLGPGSLYTSVIPNLLIPEICEAVLNASVQKNYICNLMTQPGETDGYGVREHVEAILNHCPPGILTSVTVNTGVISEEIGSKYLIEGAELIRFNDSDRSFLTDCGVHIIENDFTEVRSNYLRHDAIRLSQRLLESIEIRQYRPG